MFYDEAKIYIRSGDGGNGMISFWREKFVPLGGPDGGDGGDGGALVFRVNPKMNSLAKFRRTVHFRASPGVNGGRSNMTGARGDDLVLDVPPGTIIRNAETSDIIADLTEPYLEVKLIEGGRGGRGNGKFASSTNQAPRTAERGVLGTEMWVEMELKLIADVGLAGKPNAGKSTFLSRVSSAKPKVAAYPFTTLAPNLGVVAIGDYESIVIADIPGLIEGAADGVGLGHDFLRHIERTRVLIHLLAGDAPEPLEDWKAINAELERYSTKLIDKPQIVVLNKIDMADGIAWEPIIQEEVEAAGYEFMAISAITGENVQQLLYRVKQMIDELPEPETAVVDEVVVITPDDDPNAFSIEKLPYGEWAVHGETIERIAMQTYFHDLENARRFQRKLDRMGINEALVNAGVQPGDTVWFNDIALEWQNEVDY